MMMMADQGCSPHQPFPRWIPSLHPAAMSEEHQPEMVTTPLLVDIEDMPSHPVLQVLCKVLWMVLPITGLVLGAVYLDQCPRQPLLPIYLIILGTLTVLQILLGSLPCGAGTVWQRILIFPLQITCFLFFFAWFLAGSVWVYSIYPPDYEAVGSQSFCQRTLFLFAFGVTTALHVVLGMAFLFSLCILATFFILGVSLPNSWSGD
ncbi:transmembrane protein 272-like [Sceloporus undulatus]|uniref:transmembrane protein 272-like n=1 Tax=Sceloporus undulatus TaxID=8520 RepID=UPI001C4C855D|nr:transmembrane protein 272-like [Sceloporus undulatus]